MFRLDSRIHTYKYCTQIQQIRDEIWALNFSHNIIYYHIGMDTGVFNKP
jgi:hypothetical protein